MAEAVSAAGKLYQTPSAPQIDGKISKQGKKKINCRVIDRKIDFLAIPIL